MTIKGKIINSVTGEGIDSATITILDGNGRYLGRGVAAGTDGFFSFTDGLIDGNNLQFSAAGYVPQLFHADSFPHDVSIEVPLLVSSYLPEVIVTPEKRPSYLIPLLMAGSVFGFMLLIAKSNQNGKR